VSNTILFLFQFAYLIWPLFIVTALAYSLQFRLKRGWLRQLGRRIQSNLLYTWLVLFVIWLVTLFVASPTPTLIPEPANTIIFLGGLALLVFFELLRLRKLPWRIRARIDLHEAHGIAYLKSLDPDHFEELVAETYRALGNTAVRVGKRGDHGVDVEVITPEGQRWVVQCKRYRDSVGESAVRELYGTLVSERAARGVLVTSATITQPATAWARGKPIDLVNGAALLRLIDRARQKAAGSLFDRLTTWFERQFQPARPAPGLHPVSAGQPGPGEVAPPPSNPASADHTQPVRVRRAEAPESRPQAAVRICPSCGAEMAPHPKRTGRTLYRCTRYPSCRVVMEG